MLVSLIGRSAMSSFVPNTLRGSLLCTPVRTLRKSWVSWRTPWRTGSCTTYCRFSQKGLILQHPFRQVWVGFDSMEICELTGDDFFRRMEKVHCTGLWPKSLGIRFTLLTLLCKTRNLWIEPHLMGTRRSTIAPWMGGRSAWNCCCGVVPTLNSGARTTEPLSRSLTSGEMPVVKNW